MDATQTLIPGSGDRSERASVACPDCGTPRGPLPSVITALVDGGALYRCHHCGTRRTVEADDPRLLVNCESCELAFVAGPEDPRKRCPTCVAGEPTLELGDRSLVVAAEEEVKQALEEACDFIGAPETIAYLERVAMDVAGKIDGAPRSCRVALLAEPSFRTLALPSGTLVISTGALATLADEAELAFVLGHELEHAAAAAVPLVRVCLGALTRGDAAMRTETWTEVSLDLSRVGYGDRREHEADVKAVCAIRELGYDPEAVTRFLNRLQSATAAGDPTLAETALAHPTPADRLRHLEAVFVEPLRSSPRKVNRDIFRRVAGHSAIATGSKAKSPFGDPSDGFGVGSGTRLKFGLLWTVAGILLLASLFLLFGLI